MPPVSEPEDPRTEKTVLGVTRNTVNLKVPRFKVSAFVFVLFCYARVEFLFSMTSTGLASLPKGKFLSSD